MITKDFSLMVSTQIAEIIGNDNDSCWYKLIKFGDEISWEKPISISAFSKSILPIVKMIYLTYAPLNKNIEKKVNQDIVILINNAWKIIKNRWPECFLDNQSTGYNIRKSVGIYSLHMVLGQCITNELVFDLESTLNKFDNELKNSEVKYSDWYEGGRFSGMTNNQSLIKVANAIRNKRN